MIRYYKDTEYRVEAYALKLMTNIFGYATPINRIADLFGHTEKQVNFWINENALPYDVAVEVIKEVNGESPENYVVERNHAEDFILSPK